MGRLKLFIPLLLFIVLGLFLYKGLELNPTELPSALIGKDVPAFTLPDLQEPSRLRSEADLRNEVFLLNVWATWCVSCRVEHRWLNQLKKEGVAIIGLNYKDERRAAIGWLQELGNPYRFVISDPEGRLGLDLGVYGAPETYLVDKTGVVRFKHVGVVDDRVWSETLGPKYRSLKGGQ